MQDLMDEERKIRTTKDIEITGYVKTTKSMLVEKINTLNESTQALIRALVNEEAADRAKAIENLTATFRIRTDSMDKFFRDLIQTSVEQSKLHLTEFIKRVDIKVEEHKVWTARQINAIIKDVEEYILGQTVVNFREELYHRCSDKERLEQWNQIEEAFQVVGAKFEELDIQKREDFDGVEKRFSETLGRMNDGNETLFETLQKFDQARQNEIISLKEGQNGHTQSIQELVRNYRDVQSSVNVVNEKLIDGLSELDVKSQVREYMAFLYSNVQSTIEDSTEEDFKVETRRKFLRVDHQMELVDKQIEQIDEKFAESDKIQEMFEQKTENNFKIAEKALLAQRDYVNQLDSRLTVEEMMVRVTYEQFQQGILNEIGTLNEQVEFIYHDTQIKYNQKLQEYNKQLQEQIIEPQMSDLDKRITQLNQKMEDEDNQIRDLYHEKISDHNLKLYELEELTRKFTNGGTISQSAAGVNNTEAVEKAKKDILKALEATGSGKKNDVESLQIQTEIYNRLEQFTQKLEQLEEHGISDQMKQNIMEHVIKDIDKTLDAEVQKIVENNMHTYVKLNLQKETSTYNARLREIDIQIRGIETKLAKSASTGANGTDSETKKELEKIKATMQKLQSDAIEREKINSLIDRKIENLGSSLGNIERSVKKDIDRTYLNQNDNHKNVSSQLGKLSDQIRTLQQNANQPTSNNTGNNIF